MSFIRFSEDAQPLDVNVTGGNLAGDPGLVSTTNSSSTPLSGAAVFTGTAEDVSDYSTTTVFVDSDVSGSLSMEFSVDGTNWDRTKIVPVDVEDIGTGSVHTLEVVSQYFRVVYTNGASAQAHFRLQTLYNKYRSGFLTSSPDEVISKVNDAQIVRVSNAPLFDIARNLYADKNSVHQFGFNGAVPNGTFADLWAYGPTDPIYNWPTTDETLRIAAGGNVADTAAGAGARKVFVQYLDSNGDQQQDELTLAGASASDATTSTARRILRAWVSETGTYGDNNTGDITIENSTSGQVVAFFGAGIGQTQLSMYTIPANYTGYIFKVGVEIASGANKDADVRMWSRRDAYVTSAPYGAKRLMHQWAAVQGSNLLEFDSPVVLPALTDVWLEAQGNGAITEVDCHYSVFIVKDEAPVAPQ